MKHSRLPLAAFLVAGFVLSCSTGALAAQADLSKIAPAKINAWSVVPDTTMYARGDGLTDIYNGGYQKYTKAGVLEALRRIYQQKDQYIEVTAHQMKSADSARKFLAAFYREEMGTNAPTGREFTRFVASGSGSSTAYAVQDKWFVTVVVFAENKAAQDQALGFAKVLQKNVEGLKKK